MCFSLWLPRVGQSPEDNNKPPPLPASPPQYDKQWTRAVILVEYWQNSPGGDYTILYSHQIADIVDSRHTIISLALLQQVDLYTSDIFNIFNKTDMVAGVVACLHETAQSHS